MIVNRHNGSTYFLPALGRVGQGQDILYPASAKNFFCPSEGATEGGCGGNSAAPERNKTEVSPDALLVKARHHRKILFPLGEKEILRAQNEKSKEYFSVVWRACRAVAGLAFLVWGLLKERSHFVQKTPPRITFRKNKVGN